MATPPSELRALLACVRFINAPFTKACRIRVTQAISAVIMATPENLHHAVTVAVEREIIIIIFLCHQTRQPTYLHQQLSDDRVLPPFLRGLHDGIPTGLLVLQGLSAHRELHLPWRKQGSASPARQHEAMGVTATSRSFNLQAHGWGIPVTPRPCFSPTRT